MLRDDPIIIIGMGSSGSRMLVRLLEECGVFMGGREARNKYAEPSLFYSEINAFTDEFRYEYPIRSDWQEVVAHHSARIEQLCREVLPDYYREAGYEQGQWGFKDPRNTFTLPIYSEIFPNLRVVHLIRDGLDVAETKKNQDWSSLSLPDDTFRYWMRVWAQVVKIGRDYRDLGDCIYHECLYENLCRGRMSTLRSLASHLQVDKAQLMEAQQSICHVQRISKTDPSGIQIPREVGELRRNLEYA